jgi:outer membrane protein assembly factor BamA
VKTRIAIALFCVTLAGASARAQQEDKDAEPRYIVERIEIVGNQRTRADIIREHLFVREGQVLDEEQVLLSRLKLMNLGLFYEVKSRLKRGSRKGYVVLVFQVDERNAIVIDELFLGTSAREKWGGFGVSDHNFLGRGHWLHGAWVVSGDQQAYRLDYFAPSIPGTPLVFGGGLLYSKGLEVFPVLQGRPTPTPAPGTDISGLLDYERFGGYLSGGIKFGGFNRFLVDFRAEQLRAYAGPGLMDPQIERGRSRLFSLTWTFERDTRDRSFVASRGHRFRFSVELGSELLGGSYDFTKYQILYQQQLPTWANHSFKFDLRLGLIQGDTPFFNQFYFGDTSFFSFRDRALPRALGLNVSKETVYDPVQVSAGLEYAYPIFLSSRPLHRAYVFFATNATYTATVAQTLGQADRPTGSAWTFSFDVGLKLDTAIGVFTFSVAYLLDYFL